MGTARAPTPSATLHHVYSYMHAAHAPSTCMYGNPHPVAHGQCGPSGRCRISTATTRTLKTVGALTPRRLYFSTRATNCFKSISWIRSCAAAHARSSSVLYPQSTR